MNGYIQAPQQPQPPQPAQPAPVSQAKPQGHGIGPWVEKGFDTVGGALVGGIEGIMGMARQGAQNVKNYYFPQPAAGNPPAVPPAPVSPRPRTPEEQRMVDINIVHPSQRAGMKDILETIDKQ